MSVYDELPDKKIVLRVNERFYEKIYDHSWFSKYFQKVDQDFITQQQTRFIIGAIGGPKEYSGRLVSNAHPHIFINEEIFELRASLLKEALSEMKAPRILVDKWLKIDNSFKGVLLKKTVADCKKRYFTDEILYFPKTKLI